MKDNLGQEHVKRELLLSGQNWKIDPDLPGKMTVFSSFDPTFPPVPPQNLIFPPTQKLYYTIYVHTCAWGGGTQTYAQIYRVGANIST